MFNRLFNLKCQINLVFTRLEQSSGSERFEELRVTKLVKKALISFSRRCNQLRATDCTRPAYCGLLTFLLQRIGGNRVKQPILGPEPDELVGYLPDPYQSESSLAVAVGIELEECR